MISNVQLLLDGVLADARTVLLPKQDGVDFFELYTASKLLQPYDLSIDELEAGLVGGGGDGGIDGIYTLVDGEPLENGSAVAKRDVNVELIIFQAKESQSFSGTALDKLISTVSTVFDLGRSLSTLLKLYNERLLERVEAFRQFYSASIARISQLSVRIYYVTRSEYVHDALQAQVPTLRLAAERLFPNCSFEFSFIGATELLSLARAKRPEWLELKIAEGPLVVGEGGYIGLVELPDYSDFITDDRGNRRRLLFLDNVRDYEGSGGVNAAIAATLNGDSPEDFWTLNNGVTLLAQAVRPAYKVLALRDPKIVNGLQTSLEIFESFRGRKIRADNRTVLVRVVVPVDEASRDRIIVATNSQTPIASGVLKATDPIHKDIEEFFARSGLYYERRRNAYRNEGISLSEIVTIPQLARAVTSVLLQEPHLAVKVNANSVLLNKTGLYDRIFSRDYPLQTFVTCARIVKHVEARLGAATFDDQSDEYFGRDRGPRLWWIHWHVAMYVAAVAGEGRVTPTDLASLDFSRIQAVNIQVATQQVREVIKNLRPRTRRRTEYQLAKQPRSTKEVLMLLKQAQ
jgi:AIPR protein